MFSCKLFALPATSCLIQKQLSATTTKLLQWPFASYICTTQNIWVFFSTSILLVNRWPFLDCTPYFPHFPYILKIKMQVWEYMHSKLFGTVCKHKLIVHFIFDLLVKVQFSVFSFMSISLENCIRSRTAPILYGAHKQSFSFILF